MSQLLNDYRVALLERSRNIQDRKQSMRWHFSQTLQLAEDAILCLYVLLGGGNCTRCGIDPATKPSSDITHINGRPAAAVLQASRTAESGGTEFNPTARSHPRPGWLYCPVSQFAH